ncbi:MAG: hypothetical protein HY618_00980 [Candidatus Tectomicrobia bacterium]|uniref:Uncharacterized protein n=1 Tax=Tectimicrobiota bacterium TaxID=2528274 RepID=A0A932ZSI3_UNCTE|nr:hypothetical protein [Candidatus Tectomicrobia bacterium]
MKVIAHPKTARRFGYPVWLSALALLLAVPGAAGSVKPGGERSVVPPGGNFILSAGPCPMEVWSFDRDGDGGVDRVIVELDLTCTARAQRALREIESAADDAMKRLAPPRPGQGREAR